jgi:hypothetical protein
MKGDKTPPRRTHTNNTSSSHTLVELSTQNGILSRKLKLKEIELEKLKETHGKTIAILECITVAHEQTREKLERCKVYIPNLQRRIDELENTIQQLSVKTI